MGEKFQRIKSIAFDLEGTVIDVEKAHHQGHIYAARDAGVLLTLEECFEKIPHFVGGPDEEVAKDISKLAAAEYGSEIDYKELLEAKKDHYNQLLQSLPIQPRVGFNEFFEAARNYGLKCTIGSLTNESQAKVLLERSGVGDLIGYENIVLKEHVKNLKPAPDVWIETARRVKVNPEDQVVFEDSPRGIQGAIQIGAYCVGMPVYNRPDTVTALVKAGAKRVFMGWDEINPQALLTNVNHEHSK